LRAEFYTVRVRASEPAGPRYYREIPNTRISRMRGASELLLPGRR